MKKEIDYTKKQSDSFKWGSLSLIGTIVLVLSLWNFNAPVFTYYIAGVIGFAVSVYFWVQFFKVTFFSSRHEDGGSSVK